MTGATGRSTAGGSRGRRTGSVEITGIAAGGAGVGRLADGRVAFIHRTAPGDTVEARITSARKRWFRADLTRIIEPSPDRREPPCPLYTHCGGCTLQHIPHSAQLRAKGQIVADALRRIGHIEIAAPEVVAAPAEFEYRNRVSFHLRRLDADRVVAGFHEIERPDRLRDIDARCLLPEPAIRDAWRALRAEWGTAAHRLPAGESLRLTLQADGDGNVGLLIEGGFGEGRPAEILERVPGIVGLWKVGPDGKTVLLAGERQLRDTGGASIEAGAFTQVNHAVSRLLDAHVDAILGDITGMHIIDAYCGRGARAFALAERGARVTGIEADARATAAAAVRDAAGMSIIEGLVEDVLAGELPADVVIVNPPRAGLNGAVCDALLDRPPARAIYVSCDPATLARDCARPAARYTIGGVRCFDMFPQTAHVETVVELECAIS